MPARYTAEELRDIAEEYRTVAAHMTSLEVRGYWLRMAESVERRLGATERCSANPDGPEHSSPNIGTGVSRTGPGTL